MELRLISLFGWLTAYMSASLAGFCCSVGVVRRIKSQARYYN
ncbi:MAG TPA: hypothetical protein VK840_00665 [Candidatus Dormibacteraeota bacterium]|nr:hypothetical protein [Candidatus Dormibacteraeota bacterium]